MDKMLKSLEDALVIIKDQQNTIDTYKQMVKVQDDLIENHKSMIALLDKQLAANLQYINELRAIVGLPKN